MIARIAKPLIFAGAALAATTAFAPAARADLELCSRMSFVVETAIAVEDKGNVTSRGWFRIDPGQCRAVLQGTPALDTLYVHARALPVYGGSPLPQHGDADFCVMDGNFTLGQARTCRRSQQLARFTAAKPTTTDKGLVAYLAEDAEYDSVQARDAGIQRLLTIAGYDATPIDGVRNPKTDAALLRFIADNKLGNTAAGRSDIFDILIAAAQRPGNAGFAWCNDTLHMVMAAIGEEDKGAVTTRGWYRVAPGKCLRPDLAGSPKRLYSFGEAVDAEGQPLRPGTQLNSPLVSWGGSSILCTRNAKFELSEHHDCAGNGLRSTGFDAVELTEGAGTVVHFK